MNNIKLWDKTPFFDENINQPEPFLKPYIKDGAKSAVIVCPGGAYRDLAEHEGHPVALWLNSIGITAFVLTYRLAPYTEKAITGDILRAVRVVRSNAENFGIKKKQNRRSGLFRRRTFGVFRGGAFFGFCFPENR